MNKSMTWILGISAILLICLAAFLVNNSIKKTVIRNAGRTADTTQIQRQLGSDLKVSIPESFVQYDNYLQNDSNMFGEWEETYSFARDTYLTIGGERRPVSIGIRTYKPGTPIPPVNEDGYEFGDFEYYGFTFTKVDDHIQYGKTVNPDPKTNSFKTWNVLIYTDSTNNLRVYMYYWDTYLSDEAALRIFKSVTQSVVHERQM